MMRGIVTSPHVTASEAGVQILRQGGSAWEAAIAVSAALSVTYPHFCGLGGDAVMLLARPGKAPVCLSAIGQAPLSADSITEIATRGPGSVLTTAALADSWRILADFAREDGKPMPLQALLEPAISLARDGFSLTPSQEFWTAFRQPDVGNWRGFSDVFLGEGNKTPPAGTWLRQSELAQTLGVLAKDGPRAFYEGPLARRIAAGLQAAGAPLSCQDMQLTRARATSPLSAGYRGATLWAPPAPTQGITTLQIMAILEKLGFDGVSRGSAEHYHRVVEAIKRAFRDRGSIADPDFTRQDPATSLDPQRIATLAQEISHQAMPWPEVFQPADTVFFSVIDAEGRIVSALQSLYFDWGSGVVAGDTGILWQNRGAAFSTDPSHPNKLAPGKRPFYTLNPGLADLPDGRRIAYGTQGADGQPQTLGMVLSNLLDFGADPLSALAAPRFLLGRTFSDSRDSLKLEADSGEAVQDELKLRGHEVALIPAQSPLAGQAGVLQYHPTAPYIGAHDPRSDGRALTL